MSKRLSEASQHEFAEAYRRWHAVHGKKRRKRKEATK
jgi:hypothetical protein